MCGKTYLYIRMMGLYVGEEENRPEGGMHDGFGDVICSNHNSMQLTHPAMVCAVIATYSSLGYVFVVTATCSSYGSSLPHPPPPLFQSWRGVALARPRKLIKSGGGGGRREKLFYIYVLEPCDSEKVTIRYRYRYFPQKIRYRYR